MERRSSTRNRAILVLFAVVVLGLSGVPGPPIGTGTALARPVPVLRISSENTSSHVQTRVLEIFAERLGSRLNGRMAVEVHGDGALFRDRDVIDALCADRVGMAVPGIWHLGRFEPNFNIPLLPMFHGRDPNVAHVVTDTVLSADLSARLESRLDVHVLGRWIDLGSAHLFLAGGKRVERFEDLRGRSIRVAGGAANAERIAAFGAVPRVIPWEETPWALKSGTVEGTLTSAATVVSARLWDAGLTQAYLDFEYFPQYVPLVSGPLWRRLPEDIRQAMVETWDGLVDEARASAARDQAVALTVLESVGMTIVRPSEGERRRARDYLMGEQDRLIETLGLDPILVARVRKDLP
ncbi:MAG: TRAP transporter substrate-binding protein DctP [Rhodospirillum sp.]|nr:TRAP transporter substrate-binding protein DctP [Rhodospirillum sp.]MCF8502931.1 TRAP transporter substrate-binding protein DctP [Rhodospirillum sp.]